MGGVGRGRGRIALIARAGPPAEVAPKSPASPRHPHRHPGHGRGGRRRARRLDRRSRRAWRLSGAGDLGAGRGAAHRRHDLLSRAVPAQRHRRRNGRAGAGLDADAGRCRYRRRLRVDGGRARRAARPRHTRSHHAHRLDASGLHHDREDRHGGWPRRRAGAARSLPQLGEGLLRWRSRGRRRANRQRHQRRALRGVGAVADLALRARSLRGDDRAGGRRGRGEPARIRGRLRGGRGRRAAAASCEAGRKGEGSLCPERRARKPKKRSRR